MDKEESDCKKCFYYEKFVGKIIETTIHFCHSKGYRICMIGCITDCLDWRVHHGKKRGC